MNGIAKTVSSLLAASFLFSHGEVFSIVIKYVEKSAGQACANPSCCCDHDGPGGMEAGCGMCYTAPALFELLPTEQCCLNQANCDPKSGLPVLTVNKDLQSAKTAVQKFNFAAISIFRPFENKTQIFDFKPAVFHPPKV
jgi:hypothetical protein